MTFNLVKSYRLAVDDKFIMIGLVRMWQPIRNYLFYLDEKNPA